MYDGRQSGRDRAPDGACLGGERCPRGLGELLVLHSVPVVMLRCRGIRGHLCRCNLQVDASVCLDSPCHARSLCEYAIAA
eukprot:scaffold1702_cov560-Pavlova_lutheri.AAC.1